MNIAQLAESLFRMAPLTRSGTCGVYVGKYFASCYGIMQVAEHCAALSDSGPVRLDVKRLSINT